jgi:glutamyl-tRNA synthetase
MTVQNLQQTNSVSLQLMNNKVRVRFAPSPTGGLHLGGVRTALFNFLFAKQHNGDFILRIEDTDQSRFVPGAEEYIVDTLRWCGIEPDESPARGGAFGPYRQSERKQLYREYAEQLARAGKAYYAFDLPEELETMRSQYKTTDNPSPQYDHRIRMNMNNSLSLTLEETERYLDAGTPYVIRLKMPEKETVVLQDMIRGEVSFNTGLLDDKVLLKTDGMPTYHLAVVIDDFLMNITHVFRGEEWLSSAPAHILLWRYLFGEDRMPRWAHLPLILKPDGNGKLSKRDGERLGFPVFAMDWTDPGTGEKTTGFKERGFLPEAFVNMLALLGWNDASGQEIFSLPELVSKFDMERVHKGGAKFDFEKAKWFNHEWIKQCQPEELLPSVKKLFADEGIGGVSESRLRAVIALVKDRCTLMTDFLPQASFFFAAPHQIDTASIAPKWNSQKNEFFVKLCQVYKEQQSWTSEDLEREFSGLASARSFKSGELLQPLRIMLVGGKFGPGVFQVALLLGKDETLARIRRGLDLMERHPA